MSKTHWKQLINPDYIGAYALPDGEDMTVTIKSVRREMVTSTGGKKDECTVAQLVNNKPLILNTTNSKSIARLYGPYIEDWAGKQVTLCAATTKLAGEIVECIRIRPQVATPISTAPKPLSDDRLTAAIQSIKDDAFTLDELYKRFAITKKQKARIEKEFTAADQEVTQ